ncbi:MAG: DnaA ATPase domain-containing protein [Candidatus Poseidoniaceae archaeon]
MSIEKTNRLRIALQKAKAGLEQQDEQNKENPSKLGRLLNKPSTLTSERRLVPSQPIHERPLMAAISKEVLGKDIEYQPTIELDKSHPVSRMKNLRERSFDDSIPEGSLGDKIGFSSTGQPLWSSILDEQRNMPSNRISTTLSAPKQGERLHHSTTLSSQTHWPQRLELSQRKTFKQWKVTPENEQATSVCESIIDHLGERHNPHLIVGASEVGKSHLLNATGQSALRYFDGDVRIIRATELVGASQLPNDWQDAIATTVLLFDDVHVIAAHEDHAQTVGHLIDHALNLGVHILCTSGTSPQDWPSSRLWELLRHASTSTMLPASEASLALHIKHQTSLLGMLLEDAHIMQVLSHSGQSWRGVEAAISMLKDAHERGENIVEPEDVITVLAGRSLQSITGNDSIPEPSISLASDILKRATDVVYSEVDAGGIELHTTALEMEEDDWEPTEVSAEDLTSANDLLEMHLRTTLDELTPEAPTVLDVDSRDRHLTHQLGTVSGGDIERTAEVLTGIDASIDEALAERERLMVRDDLRLRHLELKMEQLLERTAHADANELIDIVDELRVIEHELGLVSEDAMEAFEMDEEVRIARLSTIKPTTRLLGEEE